MTDSPFEKLLVLLAEANLKFIVVGGAAVAFHGYVRLTEDLDLLVESSPENLAHLLDVLSHYGKGHARELSIHDFQIREGAVRIIEETEAMQIDLFTLMGGLQYDDVVDSSDILELGDLSISVASKASLIHWKSNSPRNKDRIDIQALQCLDENPHAFD